MQLVHKLTAGSQAQIRIVLRNRGEDAFKPVRRGSLIFRSQHSTGHVRLEYRGRANHQGRGRRCWRVQTDGCGRQEGRVDEPPRAGCHARPLQHPDRQPCCDSEPGNEQDLSELGQGGRQVQVLSQSHAAGEHRVRLQSAPIEACALHSFAAVHPGAARQHCGAGQVNRGCWSIHPTSDFHIDCSR